MNQDDPLSLSSFLIGMEPQLKILEEAEVDLDAFLMLTDDDLTELGFKIGVRRKLLNIAEQIRVTLDGKNQSTGKIENENDSDYEEEDDDDEEEDEDEDDNEDDNEDDYEEESESEEDEDEAKGLKKPEVVKRPEPVKEEKKPQEEAKNRITVTVIKKETSKSNLPESPKTQQAPSPTQITSKGKQGKQKKQKHSKLGVPSIRADEIEGTSLQGWIRKLGSVFNRWSKVWCVVKGPCLYYFAGPSELAKGMITLPSYTISQDPNLHPFAFTLFHPSAPSYTFAAHNHQDMMHWVSTLQLSALLTPTSTLNPTAKLSSTSSNKLFNSKTPVNKPLPPNAFIKYNIIDVKITRKPNQIIGLDIKVSRDHGTVVSRIHENSPASDCGQIGVGDQIVKIDGRTISGMTSSMVIDIMKELKDTVVFSIRKFNE